MLETPEKVRELQRKLYQKAKQEKEYRMDPDCESLWKKMTCLRVAASAKAGRKAVLGGEA